MSTIMAQGDAARKAVKWISDQRTKDPEANLPRLIRQACETFDLTPKQVEQLEQFYAEK